MNIIIVGCGQVGQNLAQQLIEDGNNVTVIDKSYDSVKSLTDKMDAMGIVGNGASHVTLAEAGIENADLLIAVTNSDELNLLCCTVAKKTSNCKVIARVRSHIYNSESDFLKTELGLAMVINPDYVAAQEIARILRSPSAISVETFGKGKVELLKYKLPDDSAINGMSVKDVMVKYKPDIVFATIERGDKAYIAKGDFMTSGNARGIFQKDGNIIARVKLFYIHQTSSSPFKIRLTCISTSGRNSGIEIRLSGKMPPVRKSCTVPPLAK